MNAIWNTLESVLMRNRFILKESNGRSAKKNIICYHRCCRECIHKERTVCMFVRIWAKCTWGEAVFGHDGGVRYLAEAKAKAIADAEADESKPMM